MGLLRFLFALAVMDGHLGSIWGQVFVGGSLAVQSFYVISGFYMSLILHEKYADKKTFYINRALRLIPIYWIVLTIALFVNYGSFIAYLRTTDFWGASYVIFSSLFLFGQDFMTFLGCDPITGSLFFTSNFITEPHPQVNSFFLVPQAWSLGVELWFYLLAPWLVKRKWYFIVPLLCASLSLRFLAYNMGLNHDPWVYRFFPFELAMFLLGVLAYKIWSAFPWESLKRIYIFIWTVLAIVPILLYSNIILGKQYYYLFTFPMAYFLILLLGLPAIFEFTKRIRVDRTIGNLSYPIYISHLLITQEFDRTFTVLNPTLRWFAVVLITCIISFIAFKLIDQRIDRFRQKMVG